MKKIFLVFSIAICLLGQKITFGQSASIAVNGIYPTVTTNSNVPACGSTTGMLVINNCNGCTVTQWQSGSLVPGPNPQVFTVGQQYFGASTFQYNVQPLDTQPSTTVAYRAIYTMPGTGSTEYIAGPVEITAYKKPVAGTLTTSSPTQFLNTGSGQLVLTGSYGTAQWFPTALTNGNFSITKTTEFYVELTNGACGSGYVQSNTVKIEVFKTGVLSGPASVTEGSKVELSVQDYYSWINHWEYSTDGGTTWISFNYVNDFDKPTTLDKFARTHEISSNTKFRALIDRGPYSSAYTNTIDVTFIPYTQTNPDLTNGGNYVREQRVVVSGITDPNGVNSLLSSQKHEAFTYLDGKGRPVQSNITSGSPASYDVVTLASYDRQGRQATQYLPYVMSNTNNGAYRSNPLVEQASYYSNGTTDKVADSPYPFATTVFEKSPLGKVIEQGSVGQEWQPGNGHSTIITYSNNAGGDVRLFNADGTSSGYYNANDLTLLQSTDADQKKTQKLSDKAGRIIVTRVQLDETVNGTLVPWLETYYIYNNSGKVKYMISPKGVDALKAASWVLSASILDQYVYQYVYDSRARLIEKKVPGQAWTYYCYDRLDRLVLVQDAANRSANKWLYLKYDRKGRPVMQGLYTNTTYTTRSALQTNVVDPLYPLDTDIFYEERGSAVQGYTNQSFPTANTQVLTVNYYDNYDFDNSGSDDYTYLSQSLTNENTPFTNVTGLPTGSKRLVMDGGTTWLYNYVFYDDKGHTIQVRSNNHLNPTATGSNLDCMTAVYDFEGKVTINKTYHNAGLGRITTVINKYDYGSMGRLTNVYQNNNGASTDQLVASYSYNELGQLVKKNLHYTTPGPFPFLQSVDMRYNIQGWLTSINNAQLAIDNNPYEPTDYFGMELMYEKTETGLTSSSDVLYNGNVSVVKWKGVGSAVGTDNQHSYKFTYDKANRLIGSTSQMNAGTSWTTEANALNENTTYDFNGNITSLKRNQRKNQLAIVNSVPVISYVADQVDDLSYTYNTSVGDQLLKVTDVTNKAAGFDNGTSSTNMDYTYENVSTGNANLYTGNLVSDLNKGISSITYNYLGKVAAVNFTDTRKIEYTYDAAGAKLTMKVYKAGPVLQTTTDYVNGFVYQNAALSFFASPEGRVVNNGGVLEYQYSIADHQGNTRVVFSSVTPSVDSPTATMEGDTNDKSSLYNVTTNIVPFSAANTTPGGSMVVKMNQTYSIGPARSVAVFPGDKVEIEVSEYHEGSSGYGTTGTPLTTLINMVAGAFGGVSGGAGDAGLKYTGVNNALTNFGFGVSRGDSRPSAYLNYILFDKDYNVVDAGYQLAPANTFTKQKLSFSYQNISSLNIKEPGFIYAYLSYEDQSNNWVYFDDFKIITTKTNVIQYNEYYPFGLQVNTSWTRDNTTGNNYLYNEANELNTTTGWYEMFFRNYDPVIGRFTTIDPMAEKFVPLSSYHYSYNNPIMFNDPNGAEEYPFMNYNPGPPPGFGQSPGYTDDKGTFHWYDPDGLQQVYDAMGMGDTYRNYQDTNNYMNKVIEDFHKRTQPIGYHYSYTLGANGEKENIKIIDYVYGIPQESDASTKFYFINNEADAYRSILALQEVSHVEINAYYVKKKETNEKGILILPWGLGNGRDGARPFIGMSFANKIITDDKGNKYTPLQIIHTHPDGDGVNPSGDDGDMGVLKTLNRYFPGMKGVIINNNSYNQYPGGSHGSNWNLLNGTQSLMPD
ncbi:MAG TPA: DUF6443 domain-containing protein [Cyclobacteriaceae bacterium]